ncbi:MAG: protein BatD [Candidatus Omnitrophica bacterium]|nr:protein BatD [Candidatus Omnitrophota bacterium]
MRLKSFVLSLVFLLIPAILAFAQEEVKVSTVFDKKTLEVNDQLNLTIKISGSRVNIQRPRIPVNESFDAFYSGRASRFIYQNGKQESVTEFRYTMIPKRPGVFKIGPIDIEVNDSTYRTEPVEIEVLGTPGTAPAASQGASSFMNQQFSQTGPARVPSSFPQRSAPAPAVPSSGFPSSSYTSQVSAPVIQPGDNDVIFLRAYVDKTSVYPGEQILLTYSIYTRADTRYEGFEQEPEATGFWIEELPIGQNIDRSTVTINGRRYIKADIRKMALFATAPGEFPIQPGSVKASIEERPRENGMFDDFFNDSFFGGGGGGGGLFARRVNKVLTSALIPIQVKELPTRGKPSDFSGSIGRFSFTSSIDKSQVKQNEPVTMALKIEGEGNIETLQHPAVPDLENFKIYDGESSSQLYKRGSTIVGSKSFEIIFIPDKTGDYTLPSLLFNYFDPVAGEYKATRTPEYRVKVLQGEASPDLKMLPQMKSEALKKDITKETSDIYTIKTNFGLVKENQTEIEVRNVLGGASGALGLGFLLFFLSRIRSQAYEKDKARYRRKIAAKSARRQYRKLLRRVTKAKDKPDRQLFVDATKVLDQYFADKFGVSALGLTFPDIEGNLISSGFDGELINDIRSFYEIADLARFTSYEKSHDRLVEMMTMIEKIILRVEKKR